METASAPLGKAMYVASSLDKSWLQSVQRKLFQQSQKQPDYVFAKLWGLITDPHNLRIAFARVAANRGRRTAGIDGSGEVPPELGRVNSRSPAGFECRCSFQNRGGTQCSSKALQIDAGPTRARSHPYT